MHRRSLQRKLQHAEASCVSVICLTFGAQPQKPQVDWTVPQGTVPTGFAWAEVEQRIAALVNLDPKGPDGERLPMSLRESYVTLDRSVTCARTSTCSWLREVCLHRAHSGAPIERVPCELFTDVAAYRCFLSVIP